MQWVIGQGGDPSRFQTTYQTGFFLGHVTGSSVKAEEERSTDSQVVARAAEVFVRQGAEATARGVADVAGPERPAASKLVANAFQRFTDRGFVTVSLDVLIKDEAVRSRFVDWAAARGFVYPQMSDFMLFQLEEIIRRLEVIEKKVGNQE